MIFETNTAFQKFVINQCVDFRQACLAYGVNINASKSGVSIVMEWTITNTRFTSINIYAIC